ASITASMAASLLLTGVAQALPPLPLPPLLGGPHAGERSEEPARTPPDGPAPSPVSPPRAAPDETGWAGRIVALTNDERARAGCGTVATDDRLAAAAQAHARDMADRNEMSHVGSDGSTFDERIRAAGHDEPGAENIARGYPDPETTMREWMASSGHRRNIVNCDYVTIGVGYDARGNFVAQEFGRPE
ncbi:MAG: CAP domain-containing protein, partial [Pseudonocardia sp.]